LGNTHHPGTLRKYDAGLAERAFSTVFALRWCSDAANGCTRYLAFQSAILDARLASLAGYALPLFIAQLLRPKAID